MSVTDELQRLSALHAEGSLTDDEFARAKAAVLDTLGEKKPQEELRILLEPPRGMESLGEAANAHVKLEYIWLVVGTILALFVLFTFILPAWNSTGFGTR